MTGYFLASLTRRSGGHIAGENRPCDSKHPWDRSPLKVTLVLALSPKEVHDKARQMRMNASNANGYARKRFEQQSRRETCQARAEGQAAVKYRDPKSGETWSGRGRMASWLAEGRREGREVSRLTHPFSRGWGAATVVDRVDEARQ
jgi:hypothetical protein